MQTSPSLGLNAPKEAKKDTEDDFSCKKSIKSIGNLHNEYIPALDPDQIIFCYLYYISFQTLRRLI